MGLVKKVDEILKIKFEQTRVSGNEIDEILCRMAA